MESTGSFAHTKKVVGKLRDNAFKLIDEMDGIYEGQDESQRQTILVGERSGRFVREILEKIVESTLKDKEKATV